MDNIVEISKLGFKYDDNIIFEDFDLIIKNGSFTSIIGSNGSGKSTLMKIIVGLLKCEGTITVDGTVISEDTYKEVRSKIGMVFENPDNQFVAETVMDEIAFSLENMNYEKTKIRENIKDIAQLLDIEDIMEKEPHTLSGGQKQLVALASALAIKPKILVLDEALEMLDEAERQKILKILVELNKNNNLTIINITHNSEELLYGTDIVILNQGKVVAEGLTKDILRQEKAFKNNGLELPFVVDLSYKLKYYGLVDDIVLDMDELVNIIWK